MRAGCSGMARNLPAARNHAEIRSYVAYSQLIPRLPRILLAALAWAVTVVVAVAVMSLRWHYFTDTLAGAAVGTGTAALLALLIDLAGPRRGLDRLCRAWPGRATAEPHAQPERGRTEA